MNDAKTPVSFAFRARNAAVAADIERNAMKKFEGIMGYALFTDLSTESEPELVAFGEDVSEIADDYACRRNARAEDCEDWFESPPGTLVAVDTGGDVVVRRAVYDQASDDCFISTEVTARYAWEAA